MQKGKRLLIVSILIGIANVLIIGYRYMSIMSSTTNEWEMLGARIGMNMMTPFLLCLVIGLVFNILAYAQYNRNFALVAAILYVAGVVLNINMIIDLGVEAVLCFVAFAKMEKQ